MTANKRFRVEKQIFDGYCIVDNHFDGYYAYEKQDLEKLCENLNDLNDENEGLKQSYIQLKHRHSLLHDVCVDAECDRDSYHKDVLSLEKENDELKQSVNNLKDTIVTIGIAYQKKHGGTLVDLVDEIHEEDIIDLINIR